MDKFYTMNVQVKHYLRVFLISTFAFGIVGSCFDFLLFGHISSWRSLFIKTSTFGITFSAIMCVIHFNNLRDMGFRYFTDAMLSTRQKKFIHSSLTLQQWMDFLSKSEYYRFSKYHMEDNTLKIRTGISLYGWGEIIKITPSEEKGKTGFLINIKPRCSMVYIDTGLSLKHLVQIEKVISNSDSTSLQLSPAT